LKESLAWLLGSRPVFSQLGAFLEGERLPSKMRKKATRGEEVDGTAQVVEGGWRFSKNAKYM
jgi:hypothetical protein